MMKRSKREQHKMRTTFDVQIQVTTDPSHPGHGVVKLGDAYVPVRTANDGTVVNTWSRGDDRIQASYSEESAWKYIAQVRDWS